MNPCAGIRARRPSCRSFQMWGHNSHKCNKSSLLPQRRPQPAPPVQVIIIMLVVVLTVEWTLLGTELLSKSETETKKKMTERTGSLARPLLALGCVAEARTSATGRSAMHPRRRTQIQQQRALKIHCKEHIPGSFP